MKVYAGGYTYKSKRLDFEAELSHIKRCCVEWPPCSKMAKVKILFTTYAAKLCGHCFSSEYLSI